MNKYPLDPQAIEEISRDILSHDRSQTALIKKLSTLLQDAMNDVDEDETENLDWYQDAEKLLKEFSTRNTDYEIHRFNQKNGYNTKNNSPYESLPSTIDKIDVVKENELNALEESFGLPMTEEELAKHFGETSPKKKNKKNKFNKMSIKEIEDWEKAQDNSNDIYKVSARIKNLARSGGASLTSAGDMLCNTFTHVIKALYDFAETIEDKDTKIKLIETIRKQEGMPANLVAAFNVGVKVKREEL